MSVQYMTDEVLRVDAWHQMQCNQCDGASVEFLGLVRADEHVTALEYDAYVPMADRVIDKIIAAARSQWPLHAVYVRHRVGRVPVGGMAVVIGVQTPHRKEAFAACQFIIDEIKTQAPIWKRDIYADGSLGQRHTCAEHAHV
jgi:molybdopterin synthase catalytic subunit